MPSRPNGTPGVWSSLPLALLRMAIGWHFVYEGLVKYRDAEWTAAGYLQESTGPLAGLFQWMAADSQVLRIVDLLNIWGLLLIGGCLVLGLLIRFSASLGVLLLALYYIAYPPLFGQAPPDAMEHALFINKTLLELLGLVAVVALPAKVWGLDGLLAAIRRRNREEAETPVVLTPDGTDAYAATNRLARRQVLASMAGVPVLGALAGAVLAKDSHEEKQIAGKVDGLSGATTKRFEFSHDPKDIKAPVPRGKIKDLELSRVILGGNLIGGWAHSRDLVYVSKLVKAYHTPVKINQTLQLAEACGINTILTNPMLCEFIGNYWKETGGKIQFISDCGGDNLLELIQKSIDNGACACYIQGGVADALVAAGKFDPIAQGLELIRKNGLPAGVGAHKLSTVKACVEQGLVPDYWMKTLHHLNYWSSNTEKQNDNVWCEQPEETIAYMGDRPEPWIAFKTLAAGALHPRDGFRYAFENGADFICVGMYDFQIVEDVNFALDVLGGELKRQRKWLA